MMRGCEAQLLQQPDLGAAVLAHQFELPGVLEACIPQLIHKYDQIKEDPRMLLLPPSVVQASDLQER